MQRQAYIAIAILVVVVCAVAVFALWPSESTKPTDTLALRPVAFTDLKGWPGEGLDLTLSAFRKSCERILKADPAGRMGGSSYSGAYGDWQPACTIAVLSPPQSDADIKQFFETNFSPVRVLNNDDESGLFTGYYEAELRGSRTKGTAYSTPLYPRPTDLVMVDLGLFDEQYKGRRIGGRVVDGTLKPFEDRAQIVAGALEPALTPLMFVSDPVDAFFLEIQGSGRVTMDDGSVVRVSYDAQNGRPYTAIGKTLADRGALERKSVSMQTIRQWLSANPADAQGVMNTNASYVFFREVPIVNPSDGPPGAEGLPLTTGHSLAVDRKFHSLGVPVWLDATAPNLDPSTPDKTLHRLMIAQDTGGAIRGPVRGDVYWGFGKEAAEIAGRMKHEGTMTLLLPKAVAARAIGQK